MSVFVYARGTGLGFGYFVWIGVVGVVGYLVFVCLVCVMFIGWLFVWGCGFDRRVLLAAIVVGGLCVIVRVW